MNRESLFLPKLIGLHGLALTGKDTVAKILVEDYGYTRVAFADEVKEALYVLNPIVIVGYPLGMTLRVRDLVDAYGWDHAKSYAEVRHLLQVLGTEVVRDRIDRQAWIKAAFNKMEPDKRYVISDVRFPNEHQEIDGRLGLLIKITRPGITSDGHSSESELPDAWFDGLISNDGTIGELHTKLREILVMA